MKIQVGELLFVIIKSSSPLFELAKNLRMQVFVSEQKVPAIEELDGIDNYADHLLILRKLEDSEYPVSVANVNFVSSELVVPVSDFICVSCLRLFLSGKDVKIGRVATSERYRGKGLGSYLMQQAEMYIKRTFGNNFRIRLNAQEDKSDFYKRLGYRTVTEQDGSVERFLDGGMLHVKMIK